MKKMTTMKKLKKLEKLKKLNKLKTKSKVVEIVKEVIACEVLPMVMFCIFDQTEDSSLSEKSCHKSLQCIATLHYTQQSHPIPTSINTTTSILFIILIILNHHHHESKGS